ncbi:MAG: phosphatidylglycerophosphatase A family protein [Boseongicola sp.]
MKRMLLSFFGTGYLRPAPGTWGSLAALPAAWLLHEMGGPYALVIAAGLIFGLGLRATTVEIQNAEDHDPSWIVIDEVIGQWIALIPVSIGAYAMGIDALRLWPGILAAFLLFRLFDVWKPWLVGRADARGDALGLMLDDVLAGVFAAIVSLALAAISHGWIA